jgi:nucleoside-diphosphate-sugar epimerase
MRKALITGGAGFIGLKLARTLSDRGVAVDLIDNFSRGRDDVELAELSRDRVVRTIRLDLAGSHATDTLDRDYDTIFHCAAILGVRNVINRSYDTLTLNVALTEEALRLARRQKDLASFVFASTSEVYAGSLLAGLLSFPTPEDTVLALPPLTAPRTAYMLSKLYGEALAWQSGLPVVIVRPHNVYGPRMGTEHVVPELIERMRRSVPGASLEIYSPTHSRTFCYIDDAVELIARLAESPDAVGGAWNVGTETPEYSVMRVAEIVRSTIGADVRLVPGEETPGSPTRRCPSMTRTNALCDYHQRVSLEDGVARTASWYMANPDRVSARSQAGPLWSASALEPT